MNHKIEQEKKTTKKKLRIRVKWLIYAGQQNRVYKESNA